MITTREIFFLIRYENTTNIHKGFIKYFQLGVYIFTIKGDFPVKRCDSQSLLHQYQLFCNLRRAISMVGNNKL